MLLRIFLVIAILAGAGVIAVSHLMVRPQIEEIIGQRETEKKAKVTAQNQLKDTTAKLKDTEKTLGETQTQLAASKQQTEAEQKRANGLKQDLEKTRLDLTEKEQKLARWDGIGLDPSEVKTLISSNKNLLVLSQGLDEEKNVFARRNKELKERLDILLGKDDPDPFMPPDIKGSVLVVDPKWNFVLLDVGAKQGAAQRGVFMVSRNGKLVAKVRVMSLLPERSIANIMPGWKLAEVMEGDRVIH